MREIESIIYRKLIKGLKIWETKKLDSPLDELITYDNYMSHGHFYYFNKLNTEDIIIKNIYLLKECLSDELYNNLLSAYDLYKKCMNSNNIQELSNLELEKIFMKVDEKYYENYFNVLIIIIENLENKIIL